LSLYTKDSIFYLGLILGGIDTRRHDGKTIMLAKVLVIGIDIWIIAMRFLNGRF
jgi:hypothetical protein